MPKTKATAIQGEQASNDWSYAFLAGYNITPKSEESEATALGGSMRIKGDVETYFGGLFRKEAARYPIEVNFVATDVPDGVEATNKVRDLVRTLAMGSRPQRRAAAKNLAAHLAESTPPQAKDGLLAVMVGTKGPLARVVMWRFTATASFHFVNEPSEDDEEVTIEVDFRSFNPKGQHFKSALFEGGPGVTEMWGGRIKDKQVSKSKVQHAKYWVESFLKAKSVLTDERGSTLLAQAVNKTRKSLTTPEQRENLSAAAVLMQTQANKEMSLQSFADLLNPEVQEVFLANAGPPDQLENTFTLVKKIVERRMARRITVNNVIDIQGPLAAVDAAVRFGPTDAKGVQDVTIRGKVTGRDVRDIGPW